MRCLINENSYRKTLQFSDDDTNRPFGLDASGLLGASGLTLLALMEQLRQQNQQQMLQQSNLPISSFQSSPQSSNNFSSTKSDTEEVKVIEDMGSEASINEMDESEDMSMVINENEEASREIRELQVQ